ncbi:hypothetical protein RHMOL_Rhmol06G0121000 [Rhododendron molle]|uniref:Uncharacterized protein n=1 Tax=Rhododendron molle TaxID=49168 RepID=A0ACC0NCJ5_RHOML|nr:hypothetical protein RHMOL_Rhmol06G0121000 [Rhododendron molle]
MTARPKLLVTSRAGATVESRQERASSAALKSNKSLKTEKDKPPPPLPSPDFWFRAPYLGGDDKLWRLVEADAEIGKVVDKPLLGYKEIAVEEGCFVSPKSVLRFQVERGEFPHCLSAYRNYVVPPAAFVIWADDILGNANFVELLRKADVHRAVMNSLRLVILRERKWMDVVVSRWSSDSHTLPVAWGEIGPTLEDVGCLLRLPMSGKVDPSSGRLSPSQQGVVDALRKSVRREKGNSGGKKDHTEMKKGPGGVKNTFTEWARYWYKDLGASKAGEEAPAVIDGPGLKAPAHLAAFLAYWLTWYIFPGPPKDGVDTTLFELAAILASGESVPLAPLFLGTLFKRLDMLHDAARRSCGRYDLPIYVATNFLHMFLFERFPKVAPGPNEFGVDEGGGIRESCRNVCRSARWSGSGVREVRGSIADVLDVEGEFVARPYVNTPEGVFPFNVYSEEDVVAFANKDDASTAELFRMSCIMRGELPYFVNGKYGSVTYDPMRVARQFGFDQGVPKPLLPSGAVGDVWRRFLKSTFPAELRSMNTITLPGAKRVGGCTKLYREYWRDNLARFLEYVKGAPMSLEVEDVMFQDGELCLPKVKDPALALFGARSPYVKEEVLGRVRERLKDVYGIVEKDVGSSASQSGQDAKWRAEGVRLRGKQTAKWPAKGIVEVAKPSKRKKTAKGNEEISRAVQPGVVETETEGGSEVPCNSLEVTGTLNQDAAARGVVDDIWGDAGVSSGGVPHRGRGSEGSSKVIQPDIREEAVKTRVGGSETAAGGCLEVPLDSLEAIGTFDQNAAVHIVVNDIWGEERVASRGVSHPWKGKSLRDMRPSDVVQSEEEGEEEEEEEEDEGSEGDDQGDEQREEEESEEEAGFAEGREELDHVDDGGGGESLVQNSSDLQEETNERGLRSSRRWWKEGDFMITRYPDGKVVVTLETKEKVTLEPSVLFAEAREEHRPLLSDIFFQWPSTFVRLGTMSNFSRRLALISLVSFVELLEDVSLPKATPEEFTSVYGGLVALGSYQLEVDWLRKRIDQMAVLLELPSWRDRLEKVNRELEEVEATAARLRKKKKKLEGEVAQRESAGSGGFDMAGHAGQGLRR